MTNPRPGRPVHLTISGELGSGKTSVAQGLSATLGFEIVSTGAIQRSIAVSLGLTTLEANILAERDKSIDDKIDGHTVRIAREAAKPVIFDSRMAWFFVPDALKIQLTVDPMMAAERIHGRGPGAAEAYSCPTEAAERIRERAASETRRFLDRYGVDISDSGNFDIVLDTTSLAPEDCVSRIVSAYARAKLT